MPERGLEFEVAGPHGGRRLSQPLLECLHQLGLPHRQVLRLQRVLRDVVQLDRLLPGQDEEVRGGIEGGRTLFVLKIPVILLQVNLNHHRDW